MFIGAELTLAVGVVIAGLDAVGDKPGFKGWITFSPIRGLRCGTSGWES